MHFLSFVGLAIWLATMLAQPTPPGSGTLLVLAKSDLTLSIVDPATLEVLGQAPSGPDPHEVVASADGRFAYISNYGGGSLNTISVVDLLERKALPAIGLGALRGPHGLTFVAGKLWFTAEGAKVIGRYDPVAREVDLVIGTGQTTHMLTVSDDAQRIVTSNVSSATLSILELTAGGRGQRPGGPPPGAAAAGTGWHAAGCEAPAQRGQGAGGPPRGSGTPPSSRSAGRRELMSR